MLRCSCIVTFVSLIIFLQLNEIPSFYVKKEFKIVKIPSFHLMAATRHQIESVGMGTLEDTIQTITLISFG
jgi:hypothetical protein